jgi:hypothetical protein
MYQAKGDQVNAINNLGQQIGLEINKLSLQLNDISNELMIWSKLGDKI